MNAAPHYPALVLNADETPLSIWPLSTWDFKRTLRNILKGSVDVVSEYDTVMLLGGREFRPASVVKLTSLLTVQARVPFNRMNILLRDDFSCQYCEAMLNLKEMTFDHVVPRAKGGGTNYENIVSCCTDCNAKKGDRTDMYPRRKPERPDPHLLWKRHPTQIQSLHHSWIDRLYWSGVLDQD